MHHRTVRSLLPRPPVRLDLMTLSSPYAYVDGRYRADGSDGSTGAGRAVWSAPGPYGESTSNSAAVFWPPPYPSLGALTKALRIFLVSHVEGDTSSGISRRSWKRCRTQARDRRKLTLRDICPRRFHRNRWIRWWFWWPGLWSVTWLVRLRKFTFAKRSPLVPLE